MATISPPKRTDFDITRQAWLIIFADLAALLVTFFVMLFSMSSVEMARWNEVTEELSRYLNPALLQDNPGPGTMIELPVIAADEGTNLDYLSGVLEMQTGKDPTLKDAILRRSDDRIVVSFPGSLLFAPGETALSDRGGAAIYRLGGLLRNLRNRIDVAGHTGPEVVEPSEADDRDRDWELSLGRAYVVAAALNQAGYPHRIMAYGYADSQFGELPAEMSEARRTDLARRVDIIVRLTVAGGA
ncbi:MAG: OmpA family protein [Rhodospirillaceae bacterium]|jgi:chemotaxis protein MotB|nr:OmpA family protein [Rhodospirillaceae bacterium]MBT6116331.1 OmpA family protein [Rhodospirillaceae bacterium]